MRTTLRRTREGTRPYLDLLAQESGDAARAIMDRTRNTSACSVQVSSV